MSAHLVILVKPRGEVLRFVVENAEQGRPRTRHARIDGSVLVERGLCLRQLRIQGEYRILEVVVDAAGPFV